jgi:hypothetical protein
MHSDLIIEKVGFIERSEIVGSFVEKTVPDTFVLGSINPYPGYSSGKGSPSLLTQDIFLMTKTTFRFERILRTIQKIKKYFKHNFDAVYCTLRFYNEDNPAICLMKLDNLDYLADLQSCFIDEGIEFRKFKQVQTESILELQKIFLLKKEPLDSGVYFNAEDEHIAYFELPHYINWKPFVAVTREVKKNIEDNNFDAALASFYDRHGMVDLIRLYFTNYSYERVCNIRQKYLELIDKYDF